MRRSHSFIAIAGLVVMLAAGDIHAQTHFYQPYGRSISGLGTTSGVGYSYTAPSYHVGWRGTSYYSGYGAGFNPTAYLYTTRAPQLNYIQPQYQSAYHYDRGGPAFGYSPPIVYNGLQPASGVYVSGYSSRTLTPAVVGYQTNYGQPVYRPYVTRSQYVYRPTYRSWTYSSGPAPYGAVYGAYGYSAVYGY